MRESDRIYMGQTQLHNVWVDSKVSEITFNLDWNGSDIDLALQTPNGVNIVPDIVKDNNNIEYIEGDTYKYYTIHDPNPGDWRMGITAVDVPIEGENYFALAAINSDLKLCLSLNETQFAQNSEIKITAEVLNKTSLISGAFVTAKIERPDESVDYILLYDDGMHGDEGLNDGIYGNIYTNTSLQGIYEITVSAIGEIIGEHYERSAFRSILVGSII